MKDIISTIGLMIGIILIIISKKNKNVKYGKFIGILFILVSLAINGPEMAQGFKEGLKEGFTAGCWY